MAISASSSSLDRMDAMAVCVIDIYIQVVAVDV